MQTASVLSRRPAPRWLGAPGDPVAPPMTLDAAAAMIRAGFSPAFPPAALDRASEGLALIAHVLTRFGQGVPVNTDSGLGVIEAPIPLDNWGLIPCAAGDEDKPWCYVAPSPYTYTARRFDDAAAGARAFAAATESSQIDRAISLAEMTEGFYALALADSGLSKAAFVQGVNDAYTVWEKAGHVFALPRTQPGALPAPGVTSEPVSTAQLANTIDAVWTQRLGISDQDRFLQGLLGMAWAATQNGLIAGVQTNNPGRLGGDLPSGGACLPGMLRVPESSQCVTVYPTLQEGVADWAKIDAGSELLMKALAEGDTGKLAYAMLAGGVFGTAVKPDAQTWPAVTIALTTAIEKAVADLKAAGGQAENHWAVSGWVPEEMSAGNTSPTTVPSPEPGVPGCPPGSTWNGTACEGPKTDWSTGAKVGVALGLGALGVLGWKAMQGGSKR